MISPEKKIEMYLKRDSCDNRRWMHKDGKHIRVKRNQIAKFIHKGWNEGRLMTRDSTGKFIKMELQNGDKSPDRGTKKV